MAKRVNKNLVAALTVFGMLVTTVGGVVLVKMLPQKDPAFYVEQADKSRDKKDYAEAAKLYYRAYQVSKDVKYLVEAGKMTYEHGYAAQALKTYRQAASLNPRYLPAHLETLRVTLELARLSPTGSQLWQELLDVAEKAQKLDEQNPEVYYCRGLALTSLQAVSPENLDKGLKDLAHAVKLAPQDAQKSLDLALQYEAAKKDDQSAEDVYRQLIAANESNGVSHRHYGEFLARRALRAKPPADGQKLKEQALAELTKAVELSPQDAESHIALGRYYYMGTLGNDKKKAQECFARSTELDKEGYTSYLNLGLLYLEQREPEKALEVFRERLKTPPVREGYMAAVRRNSHFMMLRHALMAALQLAEDQGDTAKRTSYIQEAEGYLNSAIAEVHENALTHQMRGEIYVTQKLDREALREMEKADELSRGISVDLKRKLAILYRRTNAPGLARKTLQDLMNAETAMQGAASDWTLIYLSRIENEIGDPAVALVYAKELSKRDPKLKDAILVQMDAYRRLNQLDQAKELAKLLGDETSEGRIRTAQIAAMQDDLEESERILREVVKANPADISALRPLLSMLMNQNRQAEGLPLVEKALAVVPQDQPQQRRVLEVMKSLLQEGTDPEKRNKILLEQMQQIEDPIIREFQLGVYYSNAGNNEESLKHYRQAEKEMETGDTAKQYEETARRRMHAQILQRQFVLLLLMGKWDEAGAVVERCAERNADGANGLFYRGRLAMARGDLTQAIEHFKQGLVQAPNSSSGLQWLGAVYLRSNNLEDARGSFDRALEINPNNGYAHLGLAQLYSIIGNEEEKAKHLKRCQALVPNDPWVRNELELQQDEENPEKGIARREEVRKSNPKDVSNLIRLAGLYGATGKAEQGEKCIQAALELAPNDAGVLIDAARFYRDLDKDKAGKGEAILKQYVQSQTDKQAKARAQVALADHYASLGRAPDADAAFQAAVDADETAELCLTLGRWKQYTGRMKEAIEWYRKSLDKMSKPSTYVHRLLLDALLNSVDHTGLLEEIERYRKNFPDDPLVHVYEGRAAMVLGRLGEAIQKFDFYLEKEQDNPMGFYLRGSLRFLRNQYDGAIADLTRAKVLAPRAFGYSHRGRLALSLERAGRIDEAIIELESILKENPRVTSAAKGLSDLYERSKRYTEQEAFVLRQENMDEQNPMWPLIRGRLLEKLNRPQEAMDAMAKACRISNFDPGVIDQVAGRLIAHGAKVPQMYDSVIDMIGVRMPEEKRTASLWRWLARAYWMKGDKEKALPLYDRAIKEASPDHELYMVVAGDMASAVGLEQLSEMMRARIQKDKSDRTATRLLAELLIHKDSTSSEAQSLLDTLLATETKDVDRIPLILRMAVIKYSQKKFEESVGLYEKALELAKDNAFALNNTAYILAEAMGKPEQALPYALRAVQIQRSAMVLDTVGWTYVLLKQYDNGIAWLLQAKDIDPNMIAGSYHLGEAYRLKGDKSAAEAELKIGLRLTKELEKQDYVGPITESLRKLGIETK